MEGVDVVVVVPQRAQRLPQLGEEPVSVVADVAAPVGAVLGVGEGCSYAPACSSQPVHVARRSAAAAARRSRTPGARRPRPTSAPRVVRRRSGGRRRPRATSAARRRPAGTARTTWCRSRAPSRPRWPAATDATAAADPRTLGAAASPDGTRRASRSRPQSRSATMQLTAQSTKNARKMSSSASRDSTRCRPSKHISSPATRPSRVERVTRRASRIITSTISEPTTAAATRHPNGSSRTRCSPSAISHLPTSGCTTMLGVPVQRPSVCPARILVVGLVDVVLRVAVVDQRPRVLGVVGLVEEERARLAEVPQPQERGEQGDRDGADPRQHAGRASMARSRARAAALGTRPRPRCARARACASSGAGRVTVPDATADVGCHDRTHDDDRRGSGVLVLAATPIGRVDDAPPRLAAELAGADVVAAEDTRRLRGLATDLGIKIPGRVVSYFEGNEHIRTESLLEALARASGWCSSPTPACRASPTPATGWSPRPSSAACASPRAGTVRRADRARGVGAAGRPVLLRGVPAAQGGGARPHGSPRWPRSERTLVFFEAPHRTQATLDAMAEVLGGRAPGGGVPGADQDPRGGTPRRAGRAGRLGRAGCARRGDDRRRGRGRARGGHRPGDPGRPGRRGRGGRRHRASRRSSTWPGASGVPKREVYDAVHRLSRGSDREPRRCPSRCPHPVVDNHCHLDIARGGTSRAAGRRGARAGRLGRGHPDRADRLRPRGCPLGRRDGRGSTTQVVAGVALHPNEAPRLAAEGRLDDALAEIERLARSSDRVRAVGETGLDYYRTGEEGRAAQHESFRAHLELAKALDKTLVIHDRDAHDDVLRVIDEVGAPERWVMHCFSGDADVRPRVPRPGRPPVLRRHGHLQERRAAARGPAGHPARPDPGRDRRAVPHPDAAPRPDQRLLPGAADRALDGRRPAGRTSRTLCAADRRQHRPAFGGPWGG